MNYREAVDYLLKFGDLERAPAGSRSAHRFDLRRVRSLLTRLGDPDHNRRGIHIAGSKGKGSTAAMLAAILHQAGYHVGLFTSPHLHSFCERIAVDGELISEADFARLADKIAPHVAEENRRATFGQLTTFELLTAMAFVYFQERDALWQVLEVGLGGRLDATNVIESKEVCIITSLGLEHTDILGERIEQIAAEKAGIIRVGVPVVLAPQMHRQGAEVVRRTAQQNSAPLVDVSSLYAWELLDSDQSGQSFRLRGPTGERLLRIPLLGTHQLENAATAVAAVEVLVRAGAIISEESIRRGLATVRWPGRMEVMRQQPLVVVDGAHSIESARRLRESLRRYFPRRRRLLLVVSLLSDKNIQAIAQELGVAASLVLATQSQHPRAAPADQIATAFRRAGASARVVPSVKEALGQAIGETAENDVVCVTGSLSVVAEARSLLLADPGSVE